jgi:DNA-binding winged helix-turn-helix (wHTH) protein
MSKSSRYLLIVACLTTLVAIVVVAVFLSWSGNLKSQSYFDLVENQTSALSDRISLYLSRGMSEVLANTVDAMLFTNDIIYIQVVHNEQIIAEERKSIVTELVLEIMLPENSIVIETRALSDGTPYVDVVKELFPFPSTEQNRLNGYVRLGRSLGQLEAELFTERLVVAGIGSLIAILIVLAAWWGIRLIRPSTKPVDGEPEQARTHVSTPSTTESETPAFESAPQVQQTIASVAELRQIGELGLDDVRKRVEVRGEPVELSPKEFDLLKLLCEEPGKVYSNDEILRNIWAEHSFASAQDVKQYIYFLRRKLETDPKKPAIIITVRGFGYKIETELHESIS